jgi:hypothetical protein
VAGAVAAVPGQHIAVVAFLDTILIVDAIAASFRRFAPDCSLALARPVGGASVETSARPTGRTTMAAGATSTRTEVNYRGIEEPAIVSTTGSAIGQLVYDGIPDGRHGGREVGLADTELQAAIAELIDKR